MKRRRAATAVAVGFSALALGRFSSFLLFMAAVPAGAHLLGEQDFFYLSVLLTAMPLAQIVFDYGGTLTATSYPDPISAWHDTNSGKAILLACLMLSFGLYFLVFFRSEMLTLTAFTGVWLLTCWWNAQWFFLLNGQVARNSVAVAGGRCIGIAAVYGAVLVGRGIELNWFLAGLLGPGLLTSVFEMRRACLQCGYRWSSCGLGAGRRFLWREKNVFGGEAAPALYASVPVLFSASILTGQEFVDFFCAARIASVVAALFQLFGSALIPRATEMRWRWREVTAGSVVCFSAAAAVIAAAACSLYEILGFDKITTGTSYSLLAWLLVGAVAAGGARVILTTHIVGNRLLHRLAPVVLLVCVGSGVLVSTALIAFGLWGLVISLLVARVALLVVTAVFAVVKGPATEEP